MQSHINKIMSSNYEIYQRVKNNLNMAICQQIHKSLCNNKPNLDFECVHIKTIPHGNLMFESAIPKPKFWSFCFLKLKSYPDSLFMFFSDREEGVFNRLCTPNNNRYLINNTIPCVYGKNTIPNGEFIACVMDSSDILYTDMNNLVINNMQNRKDRVKCTKINERQNMADIAKGNRPEMNEQQKIVASVYKIIREESIKRDWSGNCIPINIIFNEILRKKSIPNKIKIGYLLLESGQDKFASWHCWITVDNQQYDLATDILNVLVPGFATVYANSKIILSDTVPKSYTRIDIDNYEEKKALKLNNELIDLYVSEPDKFWNIISETKKFDMPGNVSFRDVKKIRDEILNMFMSHVTENNNISVKDALKVWIGTTKYNDADYKIFLKMKKMNCAKIFLSWCVPGGGCLLGGHEYVNLENETVDKKYLCNILDDSLKLKPHVKQIRKIKCINEDDSDFIVPYDDEMNMIAITVCKD